MNDWYDAEQRVEKAQELFSQQKWPEALAELRAAVAINPFNGAWHFNIGLTLDELDRFDEAIDAYRESLEIEPDDVEALAHLADDLSRTGRFGESIKTYGKIETIDASFEPCYCGRIVAYAETGDHEKAEEMFYLARQYKEDCPDCYYNMGCSLHARQLFDKAIYCWQKTIDLDDSHPQVHLRIAEALWDKGELEKARQHFLQELRRKPGDTDTLLDLGNLLAEMGRLDEAGEKFRRAIELAPDNSAAHYFHGSWLLSSERADEAETCFAKTLSLDPTYPAAHLRLAEIFLTRGQMQAARKHLRAEILLRPQDPDTLLELANLLMDCGENRPAIACLKRLIQLDPKNATAWQNMAVCHFLRGRYEEGILASRHALECDADLAVAMHNLALAHERLGNYPEALKWARQALEKDPRDPALMGLELRIRLLRMIARVRRGVRRLMFWRGRRPGDASDARR